jgi:hypothetical protein
MRYYMAKIRTEIKGFAQSRMGGRECQRHGKEIFDAVAMLLESY